MPPSHAELQLQALAALDAAFNRQSLGLAVKPFARKAFYHAEAAVQAVDHTFNEQVGHSFRY
jgi:hypothetical protein